MNGLFPHPEASIALVRAVEMKHPGLALLHVARGSELSHSYTKSLPIQAHREGSKHLSIVPISASEIGRIYDKVGLELERK